MLVIEICLLALVGHFLGLPAVAAILLGVLGLALIVGATQ